MLTTKKQFPFAHSSRTKIYKAFRIKLLSLFDNNRLAKVRLLSELTKVLSFFFYCMILCVNAQYFLDT